MPYIIDLNKLEEKEKERIKGDPYLEAGYIPLCALSGNWKLPRPPVNFDRVRMELLQLSENSNFVKYDREKDVFVVNDDFMKSCFKNHLT